MPIWVTVAGKWGSIFAVLALVITLLKQIIGFIAFLTVAIKVIIIVAFVALLFGIGMLILRSWKGNKRSKT